MDIRKRTSSRVPGGASLLVLCTLAGPTTAPDLAAQQPGPISAEWAQAPIEDVIRGFATFSGRSIVLADGVRGVFVTASLNDVPWDVALRTVLRSHGLSAVEDEYGIIVVHRIADVPDAEATLPLVVRTYRIGHAPAAELQPVIAALLSPRGSVSILASANALVVSDVERVHRTVAELLGG